MKTNGSKINRKHAIIAASIYGLGLSSAWIFLSSGQRSALDSRISDEILMTRSSATRNQDETAPPAAQSKYTQKTDAASFRPLPPKVDPVQSLMNVPTSVLREALERKSRLIQEKSIYSRFIPPSAIEAAERETLLTKRIQDLFKSNRHWQANTSIEIGGKSFQLTLLFELFADSLGSDSEYWYLHARFEDFADRPVGIGAGIRMIHKDQSGYFIVPEVTIPEVESMIHYLAVPVPISENQGVALEFLSAQSEKWMKAKTLDWEPISKGEADAISRRNHMPESST